MENNLSLENWDKLLTSPRLGEILLQHKRISIHQLDEALKEQEHLKIPLGQILLQNEIITKNELFELLELQVGIVKMLDESFDELKSSGTEDQVNKLIETIELRIDSEPDLS